MARQETADGPVGKNFALFVFDDWFRTEAAEPLSGPQPEDAIVPLESIAVRTPKTPLYINDVPHEFALDSDRLAAAVNHLRCKSPRPGKHEPRLLMVDFQEDSSAPPPADDQAIEPLHDYVNDELRITVPATVYRPEIPTEILAESVAADLNNDIMRGLRQNKAFKARMEMRRLNLLGGTAISGVTGSFIATALSSPENAWELLEKNLLGAAVGIAVFAIAVAEQVLKNKRKFGSDLAGLAHRAYDEANNSEPPAEDQAFFARPVISLVRVEYEPSPHLWRGHTVPREDSLFDGDGSADGSPVV